MCRTKLPQSFNRVQAGVSLVELLSVTSILALVLVVCAPSLSKQLGSMRVRTASSELLVHLHLARGEAIKRSRRVVLCKSLDGSQCVTSGGWEQGWIVFQDDDNNAHRGPSERIVSRAEQLAGGIRLTGNTFIRDYVSFDDSGGTRSTTGAPQAGTFTVCRVSAGPLEGRQIVINIVGRARTVQTTIPTCG